MSQSAQRPGRPTSHAQVHCIYHTSRNPGKEMTMGENASSGAQNSRPSNSSTGSEQHCDGNRIDSTGLKIPNANSDGRCLFRCHKIGIYPTLQSCERNDDGKPTNIILEIHERSKSDGLKSQVINYMCENVDDYSMLEGDAINADLPRRLQYSSLNDRILALAYPTEMPGELDILCIA